MPTTLFAPIRISRVSITTHFQGKERDLRLQFKDEPWFAKAEQFTDEWDQAAFDPAYEVDSLESFKPLIDKFFSVPGQMAKAA